jgi:hypothetical protein
LKIRRILVIIMFDPRNLEGFQKDLFFVGVTVLLAASVVAVNNAQISADQPKVGFVELESQCMGIEAGACLGIEHVTHTTHNYANYTTPEEGTEDYYRLVESELMLDGYDICRENKDMTGMEWASEAEYDNKTGSEWLENENVQLLPCEDTFRYSLGE